MDDHDKRAANVKLLKEHLGIFVREVAANLLRMASGKGKPGLLTEQMKLVLEAYTKLEQFGADADQALKYEVFLELQTWSADPEGPNDEDMYAYRRRNHIAETCMLIVAARLADDSAAFGRLRKLEEGLEDSLNRYIKHIPPELVKRETERLIAAEQEDHRRAVERWREEDERKRAERARNRQLVKEQRLLSGEDCDWIHLHQWVWYRRTMGTLYRIAWCAKPPRCFHLYRVKTISEGEEGMLLGTHPSRDDATKAIKNMP